MNKIDRYILRILAGPFFFGTAVVVFLFLMQFLMMKLDYLVGKGLDNFVIFQLIALNIPWMLIIAVPMGMLFGSLLTFGNMSASHEVTVLKASGGSLLRMMMPVIIFGIILSFSMFWFTDVVLPESNLMAKGLLRDIKKKKPTFALESGQFSVDLEGMTVLSRHVDSLSGLMTGVTIYDRKDDKKSTIISSDSGSITFNPSFSKMILTLWNGEIHQSTVGEVSKYKIINFSEYVIRSDAEGFALERSDTNQISKGQRELNLAQMKEIRDEAKVSESKAKDIVYQKINEHLDYLFNGIPTKEKISSRNKSKKNITESQIARRAERRISFLGSSIRSDISRQRQYFIKASQYEVEVQKKFSLPLACLIFIFVGAPMGIITRGGNFGISAATSLGFYVIYWICLIGGEKLADRGLLPPVLSAWLADIVVGFIGLLLTLKVSNEQFNPMAWFSKNKKSTSL